jgi:immune inhibitor A
LSDFAGENFLLRFEYVTDGAVNGRGFLLDDVAVPEIGYATDFEVDNGGWEAAGFARIQNVLPQTFHISVISNGRQPVVQTFTLAGGEPFEIPISVGGDVDEVVLVVSGTTRYTREPANYQFSVLPAN